MHSVQYGRRNTGDYGETGSFSGTSGEHEKLIQSSVVSKGTKYCSSGNAYKALLLFLLLAITVTFIIATSYTAQNSAGSTAKSLNSRIFPAGSGASGDPGLTSNYTSGNQSNQPQLYLYNVGRNEQGAKAIQDCYGPNLKQSFPDLDYALFGYNILQGYPLAIGHDPGFTLPIFKGDYSNEQFTTDCRYSVPIGLTVVPDVSCLISFASTITQNSYEFSKSLSVSAHASGGGWGAQFSASAGYKESSSTMASGEYLFIISEAKCNYYFSKLNSVHPPPLDDNFIDFVRVLQTSDDEQSYIDFFKSYGTHFSSYITFGARYINQHKMSMTSFKYDQSHGVDVAASASYSGLFSVGGGFNMGTSQRQAAANFQQNVTTTTVTVGAPPPANGDAMTWASTVKDSPVPTEYHLESIENLFTDKYMSNYDVDFNQIKQNIVYYKEKYCLNLEANGDVDSCAPLAAGLTLKKTSIRVFPYFGQFYDGVSETTCINLCMKDPLCILADTNSGCWATYQSATPYVQAMENDVIIFPTKIQQTSEDLVLFNTTVDPDVPVRKNNQGLYEKASDYDLCRVACVSDPVCFAFLFCDCVQMCTLYTEENLSTLDTPLISASENYKTVIISRPQTS